MKISGEQDIPSALTDVYRATLNHVRPDGTIQKRGPFKYPDFQLNGKKVTADQLAQRSRFLLARDLFKNTSEAERERWYNASPEWHSLLWYYNYFMMSALAGNANDTQGGIGVVKSIQVVSGEIAVSGNTAINIASVDPTKTVVFLFGNSFISDRIQRGHSSIAQGTTNNHALDPEVDLSKTKININGMALTISTEEGGAGEGHGAYAYASALTTAQLSVSAPNAGQGTIYYDWEIIENKAQTIYPIPKAINAATIDIGWPIEPDEAALISAIVIEYI